MQGYLHGFSALAISAGTGDNLHVDNAAKLVALLARKIDALTLPGNIFLNINLPNLPLSQIKGVKITRLANESHIDTVEEGHDGEQAYYWLERQKIGQDTDSKTDIWAIEQDNISITPLHNNFSKRVPLSTTVNLCSNLLQELREY